MGMIWQNVSPDQDVIIYCDGGTCEASDNIYEYLKANGFKKLRVYREGWAAIGPTDLPKEFGPMQLPGAPGQPMDASGQGSGS